MAHLFRFFINPNDIKENEAVIKEKGLIFRISRVLRLQPIERIAVLDNKGNEYLCSIKSISNNEIYLGVLKKGFYKEKLIVNAYIPLIKKDKFELIVEKLTEIGVSRIIPILSKNCKIKSINIERLKKIAKESAEQSGKYIIPEIDKVITLNNAVERVTGLNIVLYRNAKDKIESLKNKTEKEINLFLGPEADFADEEIDNFIKNKFNLVTLGKQIFKTETAAIIGTYVIKELSN